MALWPDQAVEASGLNGLTPSRLVGTTSNGPPTSGAFRAGDYVVTGDGDVVVCIASGSPGTWVTPAASTEFAAGESTIPRREVVNNAGVSTSQVLRLTYFTARKTETTTQVRTISGATAAGATPTLCRVGLYLIDANDDGTLVASIANDTTLWSATITAYTRSWTASYLKVAGQRYALGMLVRTTAAAPTWASAAALSTAGQVDAGVVPRICGSIASQTDLPSSFTAAQVDGNATIRCYAAILP